MTDQWQSPYLLFVVSNDRSVAVSVSFVLLFPMIDQWQSPYLLFVVSSDRSVAVSVSFVCCFQ